MAITVVATTSFMAAGSVNNPSVPVPSGGQSGDIYLLVLRDSSGSITPPSGFTQLDQITETVFSNNRMTTFYKTYSGTEGSSFTFALGTFSRCSIICSLIRGSTGVIIDSAIQANGSSTSISTLNYSSNPVTTTASNQFVWLPIGGRAGTLPSAINYPSGFTEAQSNTDSGVNTFIAAAYKTEASATTIDYTGSVTYGFTVQCGVTTSAIVLGENIVPLIIFKQYANGAFQATRFVEGAI